MKATMRGVGCLTAVSESCAMSTAMPDLPVRNHEACYVLTLVAGSGSWAKAQLHTKMRTMHSVYTVKNTITDHRSI